MGSVIHFFLRKIQNLATDLLVSLIISPMCLWFVRKMLHATVHNHPLVYMRGVHYNHLSAIVDFIYHGEVEITNDNLEAFLEVSKELGVEAIQTSNYCDE